MCVKCGETYPVETVVAGVSATKTAALPRQEVSELPPIVT